MNLTIDLMTDIRKFTWKRRNFKLLRGFNPFLNLFGLLSVKYFGLADQILIVFRVTMASTALYKRLRIRFYLWVWVVRVEEVLRLCRVVKVEETWLDKEWIKLVEGSFIIREGVPKRWRWAKIRKSKPTLTGISIIIILWDSFFFLSCPIVVLNDGFANHILVVFWIILTGFFLTVERLAICVWAFAIVYWILVIILLRIAVLFIEKPTHLTEYFIDLIKKL